MTTKLLTLSEAAASLGLATSAALRMAIRRGTLRATRYGTQYLVEPKAVEDYRRNHLGKVGPKPRRRKGGVDSGAD